MHHDKKNQPQQGDKRPMAQDRDRDMSADRNEEETGKPVQLDKEDTGHHQGGQHQGGAPQQKPGTERKPDQGQHTTQR